MPPWLLSHEIQAYQALIHETLRSSIDKPRQNCYDARFDKISSLNQEEVF